MTNERDLHTAASPSNSYSGQLTATKYCSGCGKLIHKDAPQCPTCGAPQAVALSNKRKNKTAAILLALFLGGIGVHKFYLGQWGWGILYLLFCWTFIPAIIALVELVIYITMSEERFAQKYG